VDKVTKTEVIFKSGARAVIDKEFEKANRKSNLAVWRLETGKIPVTSDKPASLKYSRRRPAGQKKQGETTGGFLPLSTGIRNAILKTVENEYVFNRLRSEKERTHCVYTKYSLSLFMHLLKNADKSLQERVLPVMSLDKLDFYLMLEPFKYNGDYLIDESVITEWWNSKDLSFNVETAMQKFSDTLTGSGAKIYTNTLDVIQAVDNIRFSNINESLDGGKRNVVQNTIIPLYEKLEKDNSIGSLGDILPASLHDYYRSNPLYKLVCDELRYIVGGQFMRLESEPVFDQGVFSEIKMVISEYLSAGDRSCRENVLRITNYRKLMYSVDYKDLIGSVRGFVNSTCFVYIPLTIEIAKNYPIANSTKFPSVPDFNDSVIQNAVKYVYYKHSQQAGKYSDDIVNRINNLSESERSSVLKLLGM
jgi:hypothetical protein